MSESILSIEALESDLKYGQAQLEKAQAARLRAHEVEDQWSTEVTSLKNLIEVRRKRLGSTQQTPNGLPETGAAKPISDDMEEVVIIRQPARAEAVSHVDWIYKSIVASGAKGMSPPEILKASTQAGRSMHENYPYVVLREFVEKGKVTKREGRYYAA